MENDSLTSRPSSVDVRPHSMNPLQRVLDSGIVAIIRASNGDALVDVAEALIAGGIQALEVTFTVPNAVKVIERVVEKCGSRALIGAGTVLDTETARIALLAGAEFIVSPNTNLEVIKLCKRYSKLIMPGAFTPTEVITAWEAGADIVKIFPAEIGGPGHIKALRGPFPQVRLLPTGGVNLETAPAFLRAGACAIGCGSTLIEPSALERGDMKRIETLARQYAEIVQMTRRSMGK